MSLFTLKTDIRLDDVTHTTTVSSLRSKIEQVTHNPCILRDEQKCIVFNGKTFYRRRDVVFNGNTFYSDTDPNRTGCYRYIDKDPQLGKHYEDATPTLYVELLRKAFYPIMTINIAFSKSKLTLRVNSDRRIRDVKRMILVRQPKLGCSSFQGEGRIVLSLGGRPLDDDKTLGELNINADETLQYSLAFQSVIIKFFKKSEADNKWNLRKVKVDGVTSSTTFGELRQKIQQHDDIKFPVSHQECIVFNRKEFRNNTIQNDLTLRKAGCSGPDAPTLHLEILDQSSTTVDVVIEGFNRMFVFNVNNDI